MARIMTLNIYMPGRQMTNHWQIGPKKAVIYFLAENAHLPARASEYYKVLTIPLSALPKEEIERIDTLIKWTHAPKWLMNNRSIKPNDIIFCGNTAYLLKPPVRIDVENFDSVIMLTSTDKVVALKIGDINDCRTIS